MFGANGKSQVLIDCAKQIFVNFIGKKPMFAVERQKFGHFGFVRSQATRFNQIISARNPRYDCRIRFFINLAWRSGLDNFAFMKNRYAVADVENFRKAIGRKNHGEIFFFDFLTQLFTMLFTGLPVHKAKLIV